MWQSLVPVNLLGRTPVKVYCVVASYCTCHHLVVVSSDCTIWASERESRCSPLFPLFHSSIYQLDVLLRLLFLEVFLIKFWTSGRSNLLLEQRELSEQAAEGLLNNYVLPPYLPFGKFLLSSNSAWFHHICLLTLEESDRKSTNPVSTICEPSSGSFLHYRLEALCHCCAKFPVINYCKCTLRSWPSHALETAASSLRT